MGLESVELLMEVEDVFGIEVPDHIVSTLRTVGELHSTILFLLGDADWRKCAQCGYPLRGLVHGVCPECGSPYESQDISADASWRTLESIVRKQLGLRADAVVTPATRFVEDLNMG